MTCLSGCYVLIIESNLDTAKLIKFILKDYKVESVIVSSVIRATQVLKETKFNVVISAYTSLDGTIKDLIEYKKQHKELRDIPVISLTGNSFDAIENSYSICVRKILLDFLRLKS